MSASESNSSAAASDIAAHNPYMGNRLDIDGFAPANSAEPIGAVVGVSFADGEVREFHNQWLRHSCYCPKCGNPADGIRFSTVVSFESDVAPSKVWVEQGDVRITWLDGHESTFAADWLRSHAYAEVDRRRRAQWRPTTWRAELAQDFPTVNWIDAASGGLAALSAYEMLADFGIVRIVELGTDPIQTEKLAGLIGPIHETTVYGRIYDVKAEPVAKLGAKTGMPQAPHIDDAFYYSQPGIDVFHCLVNTAEGGMSTYVDGFAIAESLKAEVPDAYEALTRLPVAHIRRHPGEIDLRNRGPLISLDEFGQPCGIRYFDRALAPLDVPADQVGQMYDAIREYSRRMVSSEFVASVRVAAGDGMLIDNHRVMHGRTAFDPAAGRHIRLCHVPRDEFHGRYRELSRRLKPSQHDLYYPQGSQGAS